MSKHHAPKKKKQIIEILRKIKMESDYLPSKDSFQYRIDDSDFPKLAEEIMALFGTHMPTKEHHS